MKITCNLKEIRRYIIPISFLFMVANMNGQGDSIYIINQSELEEIVDNQNVEGDLDIYNTIDELSTYIENPININEISANQLYSLQLLHDIQITSFLEYRNSYGPFISIYELQAINNWDVLTIERVLPYLTINNSKIQASDLKNMATSGKHEVFIKSKRVVQNREGYNSDSSNPYLGDPNHFYLRYRYNYGNKLRWGMTAEKDPGEQFFNGFNKKGFDYYSGFLYYQNADTRIKSINLGDYTISMGQGLIVHNAFGAGKSSQTINIKKSGKIIRPYSSVNESNFFRGIATELAIANNLHLTGFFSYKYIDGTIITDTLMSDGFNTFSSIVVDGYHRTENEINKANSTSQTNYGGVLTFTRNNLKWSANYLHTGFNNSLDIADQLYRTFSFEGKNLDNFSTDISYFINGYALFGEFAMSGNGGKSWLTGLQKSLHPSIDIGLLYRNYDKDYQVLNARAFSESTLPVNEEGLYLGLVVRPLKSFIISAYHDMWKNPWLRFRVDSPSNGKESFIRIEHYKKRKYQVYLQYKYEIKAINQPEGTIRSTTNRKLHRLRLHLSHSISQELELRNRAEYSRFSLEGKPSNGWMIYQDIIYKPLNSPISFTSRIAFFDTDDFDSRIYAYENDILYEFRIPFFQNEGTRFYINTRYRINRKLTAELRYERTQYFDIDEISSGGELIEGNTRSEIKTQIKYKF